MKLEVRLPLSSYQSHHDASALALITIWLLLGEAQDLSEHMYIDLALLNSEKSQRRIRDRSCKRDIYRLFAGTPTKLPLP